MSKDDQHDVNVLRRAMIKIGGMALIAVWGPREVPALAAQHLSVTGKPMFLAPGDATDVVVHSRAENLFWCDMMMEHADFLATLMPGKALAAERAQAENFQRSFQSQYDRAKAASFDRTNYGALNRSTVELMHPFIEYKLRMLDAQQSGRIRTLLFPLFFEHTAREAQRATARLEALAGGNITFDYPEVVDFWTASMSDDAAFIAHLLDPQEQDLISSALDSSAVFKGFNHANRARKLPGAEVVIATEDLIDFETTIEEGINAGQIKSIIDPTLADHMRRESLKFIDELKRTGSKT